MKLQRIFPFFLLIGAILGGCSEDNKSPDNPNNVIGPGENDKIGVSLDTGIKPYDGRTADDFSRDKPSSNDSFYWEAGEYPVKVEIRYDNDRATVTSSDESVLVHTDGANVVVDGLSNLISGMEIKASGHSDNGSLKIYGVARTLLTLDGLELTSRRGPAINSQNKKRLMINLSKGSVNRLEDAREYESDHYYLPGASQLTEDRKGCLFAEGHIVLSGEGTLRIKGNYRHGLVTDGYFYMRPGVTLVIDEAAKNAIHVKGDITDGIGVSITGGYLYANTSSPGGRAIKCDLGVSVSGGSLSLNASGDAVYDETDRDLQSAAGIKAATDVNLRGGQISIRTTGKGGKGINAGGSVYLSADNVSIAVSGEEATDKAHGLSSAPKGVKADRDVYITSGDNMIYATDDALSGINLTVRGGRSWIYSIDKDAIDMDQSFSLTSGLLIASGDGGNASGIDTPKIYIYDGTILATGGRQDTPEAADRPWVSGTVNKPVKGHPMALRTGKEILMSYIFPRSLSSVEILYSSPLLPEPGSVIELLTGGKTSTPNISWNGLTIDSPLYTGGSARTLTVR